MKKITSQQSKINNEKLFLLIILTIILIFGIYARIGHLFKVDFNSPVYLGGLFAEFAQQITESNFSIPKNIPFYTENGIPFAYPPLPFYILAFFIHIMKLPEIPTINLFPPALSIISLISFWFLSKKVFEDEYSQILSTLFFAVLPIAFREQIEAAGLAEATGTIAIIWLIFFFFNYKKLSTIKNSIYYALAISFSLVSSPGSAYAAIIISFIFMIDLVFQKKWKTILIVLLVTLIASSFYWISILNNHGIQVITNPFFDNHTGFSLLILQKFIQFAIHNLIDSSYFILTTLMIFGLFVSFENRQFQIMIFFLIFSILPREGKWLSSIPVSLILGSGTQYLFSLLKNFSNITRRFSFTLLSFWLLMALIVGVVNEHNLLINETDIHISEDAKVGMSWVKNNLPQESYFIVLPSPNLLEWFPHISRRTVLNVEYGAEWDLEDLEKINLFKNNSSNCETFECYSFYARESFNHSDFFIVSETPLSDKIPFFKQGSFYIYSTFQ